MTSSHRRVAVIPAVLAVVVLVVSASCGRTGTGEQARQHEEAGQATVTKVADGDTIHVRVGGKEEKVRLIGIDTPETHGPGGLRECFGPEATRRAEDLLPAGTTVRLVRDVEPRDRYGRLLAYVYRTADGLFVNMALAGEGYAATLTYPPNVAFAKEFDAATRTARRADRGLWQRCGGPDTAL